MQLTVEAISKSKSGKALRVKAGNDWYGADLKAAINKGDTIEAVVEDGQYGKWITRFLKVDGTDPEVQKSKPTGGVVAPWWAPFMSNVVAHAIASGLVQKPEQLDAWARQAMRTAVAVESDTPF